MMTMITIIYLKMKSSSFKHLSLLFKNIILVGCYVGMSLGCSCIVCIWHILTTKLGRDFYNLNHNKSTRHGTKSNGTVPLNELVVDGTDNWWNRWLNHSTEQCPYHMVITCWEDRRPENLNKKISWNFYWLIWLNILSEFWKFSADFSANFWTVGTGLKLWVTTAFVMDHVSMSRSCYQH
jgi:hypothetical protein